MPTTGIYPDFYPELPGSVVELKDGVKNKQSGNLVGKNVVLIGTAIDGPVLEPVTPRSYDQGETIFGRYYDRATKTFNGATLMRAYERVLRAGADTVTLLRLTGEHASGKIDLYKERRTKTYQAREYAGKYPGNDQTEFDLGIAVKDGFDDVYITEVSVYADGALLNAYKYKVDNSKGVVTVFEDVAQSGANISIKYTLVDVIIYTVTDESPIATTNENIEFKLANENIVEGSEVLSFTAGESMNSEPTFSIDYKAGLITFDRAIEEDEEISFDYSWQELTQTEGEFTGEAGGTDFFFDLQHTADASKPIVITINGNEISSDNFDVNYNTHDTTRVYLRPGLGDLNADVYIRYYWNKEELVEPKIDLESVFGGNLYNKVKFEIQDELFDNDGYTSSVNEESPNIVKNDLIRLKNQYIVPDSVVVTVTKDDDSTITITKADDVDINYAKGEIVINDKALLIGATDSVAVDYDFYNVAGKVVRLYKPAEKLGDTNDKGPIEFVVGDRINTIGELVSAINEHPRNNVVRLSVAEEYVGLSALELKTPDIKVLPDESIAKSGIYLSFGKDGINITKEEIYELLEGTDEKPGAYEIIIEDEDVDILIPLGVYADDDLASEFKSFDQQLANACARAFYRNNEIRGLIGIKPLKNPTRVNVINRVKKLQEFNTDYFLTDKEGNFLTDREGNRVDVGKFISVVAHDVVINDRNLSTPSIENGVHIYGGVASMLEETNSPTNEILPEVNIAYRYSNAQANILASNKMVTFKNQGGRARVVSAVTCAQPGSGWTRYHTVDIVFDAIDLLRRVYDPYIGQGNTLEKRNSLDSEIRNALKNKNTIVDFDYDLIQSATDKLMGRMVVELDIIPVGEMQRIHTVVSINAQLD